MRAKTWSSREEHLCHLKVVALTTQLFYKEAMQARALVSGTSRGIGLAVASELLERGWEVWGMARAARPEVLRHERYLHVELDLSNLAQLELWLDTELALPGRWQGLTRLALVNNAGQLGPIGPLGRGASTQVLQTLALNAVAPALLASRLLERGPTCPLRIVDLSSGAATRAYSGWGAYCASKAALRMLGQVLAGELQDFPHYKHKDVRFVSYAPHVVDTQMQAEIRASSPLSFPDHARFLDLHLQGKLVPALAPACAIADLLMDDSLPQWSEARYQP